MDQDDTETSARLFERFGEPCELAFAKPSGCHEWTGRHASRKRNQRHVGTAAYEWKALAPVIAAHVIAPKFFRQFLRIANISVVVAGNHGDVRGPPDRL